MRSGPVWAPSGPQTHGLDRPARSVKRRYVKANFRRPQKGFVPPTETLGTLGTFVEDNILTGPQTADRQ